MFKKLRNKLLIINIVIISIVMLTSFLIIYIVIFNSLNEDAQEKLDRASLGSLIHLRDPVKPDNLNSDFKTEFNTSFNILVNEEGEVTQIASSLSYEDNIYYDVTADIFDLNKKTGEIKIEDKTWLYKIEPINDKYNIEILNDSEYRIAFVDITDNVNTLNDLLTILIIVGIIVLIIIYFISLYFANKSIKPIEKMWNKQKRFVADATHELKTPLTIISANTDLILLNPNETVKKQNKWFGYIKNEIKGMNKLVNELLNSAKIEEDKLELKNTNISNLLNEILLTFEAVIYEKNIKLNMNIEKDIFLTTDIDKLNQVIKILLDNAVKYTESKGTINIKLFKKKRKVIIQIKNTSKTISKQDIEYIFDRFYKGDKSRTDRKNSFGLGLYIAKTITNKLKGEISCESNNELTTFTLKF